MSELGSELKSWLKRAGLDIKTDWGRINVLLGGSMVNAAKDLMEGKDAPSVVRHAARELVACANIDAALRLRCEQRLDQLFRHAERHHGIFGAAPDGRPLDVWKSEVRKQVHERFGVPVRAPANARRRRRLLRAEAA